MTQPAAPLCIVTRPEPEATRFSQTVAAQFGLEAIISPLMVIAPLQVSLRYQDYNGVILTSANAARQLAALAVPYDLPVFAVGDRTAQVASDLGYTVQSAGGDADALVMLLGRLRPKPPLLHLRGEHTCGEIAERLRFLGVQCEERIVYQQVAQKLTTAARIALEGEAQVILPLFSPRSASILGKSGVKPGNAHAVALSAAVAKPLEGLYLSSVSVASRPDEAAMRTAIGELLSGLN